MAKNDLQREYIDRINEEILPGIDFDKLDLSCNSAEMSYAEEVLGNMHCIFMEVYGSDTLECRGVHKFVTVPAVILAHNSGRQTLALLDLDLGSSGEHWGTAFFSPVGVLQQDSENNIDNTVDFIQKNYIPYDYWYTPNIHGDFHIKRASVPQSVASLLTSATNWHAHSQGEMEMTQL